MMIIYLAGHAEYAQGVYNTLKFFKNEIDNVYTMDFNNKFEEQMGKFIKEHEGADLIVITDLLGGSVNQCAMKLLKKYEFKLFTGVNIGFMLEILFTNTTSLEELTNILCESRKSLVFVNEILERSNDDKAY